MLYLENAQENFGAAAGTNAEEVGFYRNLALMIPDQIDVDNLILAIKIALMDLKGGLTPSFISVIPKYVVQISTPEFFHEFREKFNLEILGITQEKLPEVDFGYNEVSEDVIDISNKDKYEVLAALYNASTPVGLGFAQYNPLSWNKEFAKIFCEKNGYDVENMSFKWIFGRPVSCSFNGNLVYVANYNNENEPSLAQRAIATCKNIEPTINKDAQRSRKKHNN